MKTHPATRVSTGVPGLDEVLGGGLPARRLYLLQGDPGAGKTTLGMQFLLDGVRRGERCLFVTLSESKEELLAVAASHGWSLDGVDVFALPAHDAGDEENTLYLPAEVELGERVQAICDEVARVHPTRVVLDSCSELRLLAQTALRFRRQLLALKETLVARDCTVLLLENPQQKGGDPLLQSLTHGVIAMEQRSPTYGTMRRQLQVMKLREVEYRSGYHDMVIRAPGIEVFPRLSALQAPRDLEGGACSSEIPALDALLGGGLERGTSTLVLGPTGCGKSALANQYAIAAARRGDQVAVFTFDEGSATLRARSGQLGMALERSGRGGVTVHHEDPLDLSFGEFTHRVRATVEEQGCRMVVIDSLNSYLESMPDERFLSVQVRDLLGYLRGHGVVAILVMAQHGLVGTMETPLDVSYLADTVILIRYFEALGRVRKAISVVKKRAGMHEDTIRELKLDRSGITVGPPLKEFRGVLTGVPRFQGSEVDELLSTSDG